MPTGVYIKKHAGGKPYQKGDIPYMKGRHHRKDSKEKIGKANKGRIIEECHGLWKGNNVGYRALHTWVYRRLGIPIFCTFEDFTCKGRMEWASLSHEAKRDLNDFISLCKSHHVRYDKRRNKLL